MITSQYVLLPQEIFYLQNKIAECKAKETRYLKALFPTFAASLMFTGINFYTCNPICGLGALSTLVFGASCTGLASTTKTDQARAKILLKKCHQITKFMEVLNDFELSPEDQKAKNVFTHFSLLSEGAESSIFVDHQLIDQEDLQLFQCTGKVFLMDEVAAILKKNDKNSLFAEQWDDLLASDVNDSYDVKEPWKTVGMYEPDVQAYRHFFMIRHQLTPVSFADNILSIFKHAVGKAINTHVV